VLKVQGKMDAHVAEAGWIALKRGLAEAADVPG